MTYRDWLREWHENQAALIGAGSENEISEICRRIRRLVDEMRSGNVNLPGGDDEPDTGAVGAFVDALIEHDGCVTE